METFVILRRNGWRTPGDLQEAAARSTAEGDRTPDDIRWIRSYVLGERGDQGRPAHGGRGSWDQTGVGAGSGRTITVSATAMISSTGRSAAFAWARIASGLEAW